MSDYQRNGAALVLCAPSGTGKTTLARRMLAEYPRIAFSISYTTRPPRPDETNGQDYYFVKPERFRELVEQHYFAEWAMVHGFYYGTPLAAAMRMLEEGKDLLFDVDVQGAAQLKNTLPSAYFVFVLPPSRSSLEQRLRQRASDSEEDIRLRLTNALLELKQAAWFNTWVVNDDPDKAFKDLCAIYQTACLHPMRSPNLLQQLVNEFEPSLPEP
ncbi:MAG: guanylate kinase [Desulfovibrionaceae bacterium]|nr:guanylate kinase [Desulfovibrionaceae bacterium]